MQTTRIIAAVLDSHELKLYKEDGSTISLLQGDTRIQAILDKAIPAIDTVGYVDLDLTVPNYWADYEKKSSGLVRFFSVAKSKLKSIFGNSEPGKNTAPVSVGKVPDPASLQKAMNDQVAVAEIMKHAKPMADTVYTGTSELARKDETLIAVVGKETPTVVPGVENLKRQVERASISGATGGVDSFMQRISKVITTRRHSIEELMRFMQRGDLPVSASGQIIIYKVLRKRGEGYVDCHSGRVTQRVGSLVRMDEKLVDFNRNQECSNGLHVARREYIRSFPGDVCVVAVVRPEDVIAVPNYDANKMRVCAYHILFELTQASYGRLKNNQPIDPASDDAKKLARALADGFPPYNQIVEIRGSMGQNIEITDLVVPGDPTSKRVEPTLEVTTEAVPDVTLHVADNNGKDADDNLDLTAPKVDPKKVATQVSETKNDVPPTTTDAGSPAPGSAPAGGNGTPVTIPEVVATSKAPPTKKDQAKALYDEFLDKSTDAKAQPNDVMASAKALLLFKQRSKVSWQRLGFDEDLTETLTKALKS